MVIRCSTFLVVAVERLLVKEVATADWNMFLEEVATQVISRFEEENQPKTGDLEFQQIGKVFYD